MPMRFSLPLVAALMVAAPAIAAPPDPAMMELADKSRCFQCHDLTTKISGPAWTEVAKRYRGRPDMVEPLVKKVKEGGTGAWGTEVMSPNKRVKEDDIRTLVKWILTLE
ncbi:Cytochrome c, class I [Magnetospirillum sp. LM-5]|nr:Cytochrome c, class I [Magnetospirillum sp. LM-5]